MFFQLRLDSMILMVVNPVLWQLEGVSKGLRNGFAPIKIITGQAQ
jgi:hypothetical protein